MASSSINMYYLPMTPARRGAPRRISCPSITAVTGRCAVWHCAFRRVMICSAAQESTTATVADKGAEGENESVAEKAVAPPKPKPAAAKAAVKPLRDLMEEDVIPSLKEALESQDDISLIELSFGDNRLEGSFSKKDVPYVFWAFFPDGGLTGPKGFSLSSYGSKVSTVEPFLNDEKKITSNHVVFWVVKRLAAQGIIPVWKEE